MQAVILAGGKGTRLRPYTTVLPKPLMPIGDMPVLEVVLRHLRRAGFTRVTMAVSYLAELIEAFCGDGSRFGLSIAYSREEQELSTAGPLKLIRGLDETFLVMNGDLLTTLDYAALLRRHKEQGAAATIAAHRRTVKIDYGVIEPGPDGTLGDYIEKPEFGYLVRRGVNVLEPSAIELIGENEKLGMPDLMLRLKAAGRKVLVHESPCLWLDIGRVEDYERATEVFSAMRAELLEGSPRP